MTQINMTAEAVHGLLKWLKYEGLKSRVEYANDRTNQREIHHGRMSGYTLVREVLADALHEADKVYGTASGTDNIVVPLPIPKTIGLTDDGTLDTVLFCDLCGDRMRFSYQNEDTEEPYDEWRDRIIDETQEQHVCQGNGGIYR